MFSVLDDGRHVDVRTNKKRALFIRLFNLFLSIVSHLAFVRRHSQASNATLRWHFQICLFFPFFIWMSLRTRTKEPKTKVLRTPNACASLRSYDFWINSELHFDFDSIASHLNVLEWIQWAFDTQLRKRPHARAVISVIKPNNHSDDDYMHILCGHKHVSDADPLAPQSSQISQKRRTNDSRANKTNNRKNRKMPLRRCYPTDRSVVVCSALKSQSI